MEWRYLIKQFILPPGGLYVLLAFAVVAWHWRPRLARLSVLVSVLCLWLLSTPAMVSWLATPLESQYGSLYNERLNGAQAIVILGGGREIYGPHSRDHEPSPFAMARVREGAKLAKQSRLPVLVSGGLHYGKEPSEALLMARVLMEDYGLPIPILEERSRTTWENATHSAAILMPQGQRHIALVTHAWHMPRSKWSFEQQGFKVEPIIVAPYSYSQSRPGAGFMPEAKALFQSVQLINEYVGLAWYRLMYRASAKGNPPQ